MFVFVVCYGVLDLLFARVVFGVKSVREKVLFIRTSYLSKGYKTLDIYVHSMYKK